MLKSDKKREVQKKKGFKEIINSPIILQKKYNYKKVFKIYLRTLMPSWFKNAEARKISTGISSGSYVLKHLKLEDLLFYEKRKNYIKVPYKA